MSQEGDDLDRRIAAQLALRDAVLACESARVAADRALIVRDELIRAALNAGVRSGDVRAIAGVSSTRLSQIRRQRPDVDETP
jgi:hypothetical protein